MRVLLFSPLAGRDPASGDISYTEALLAEPPPGVEYTTYADAIDRGLVTIRGRRGKHGRATLTDLMILGVRCAERFLRGRGMMFREPWWFVSIRPGEFDLVHQHLFPIRQIGTTIPVLSTAGYPLSVRYGDVDGWSTSRVRRATSFEKLASKILRIHNPWLVGRPSNVMSGYSLKFWAFLVSHGASSSRTRVISTGLQELRLPAKQSNGRTLAFIGRDFARKGGPDVIRAFRILKGRVPDLQLIVVTSSENAIAHDISGSGVTLLVDIERATLLYEYLPKIDILISPTTSDCGAPYAVLEALQSGAAVVLSQNDWLDDRLIEPAVRRTLTGVSALVETIADLLEPQNLAFAQAAARPLWQRHFSMTALQDDLVSAYVEALPKGSTATTATQRRRASLHRIEVPS